MKKLATTIAILFIIVAVFCGTMFGLNFITGPIIEANQAGAANDRLNSVMPGGQSYTDITATLTGVPSNVVKVSKENSGKGFVIEATATSKFSNGAPMDIIVGVDTTGKICGIKLASHSETAVIKDAYIDSFIGKDSALAGVDVWAGSTYSFNAFKNAVEAGMGVLISNDLIQAGVKSDAQILEELIPTVAPGITKLAETTVSGNIQKAYKSGADTGFAYIVKDGDATYLAIVNATGACKVYNTESTDVTAEKANVVLEATAHASANQKSYAQTANTKFGKMVSGASDFTAITIDTFNTIAYATTFKANDKTYYGFYSRVFGFDQMEIFYVIDQNGAIVKMDATEFIFHEEYFGNFGGYDKGVYTGGFAGLTSETWSDDVAVIATATMTSNAVKQATKDAFSAFDSVKGGLQ